MLEGGLVVLYVLVVVVGIGEKVASVGEDVGRRNMATRKVGLGGVFYFENFFGIVVEESALFVAKVDREVFVTFDFDGMINSDGTVVGSDDDIDVAGG